MQEAPQTPASHWMHAYASCIGTQHTQDGTPCQDASGLLVLNGTQEVLLLALSDGAGSCQYAEKGSQLVVSQWLHYFRILLENQPDPAAFLAECDRALIFDLLKSIREAVAQESLNLGAKAEDFSATLLGAVLTTKNALLVQVGDGAWVGSTQGTLTCLTWPTAGEFAGQTVFAISPSAEDALQLVYLQEAPAALAGFTDGLERLLLDFQTRLPVEGFFIPAFRSLLNGQTQFQQDLEAFLNSDSLRPLTNDDKSLALLVQAQASL
jgi:hypothetical protein